MKRGWVRILFLVLVFCMAVAAAALRVFGVATAKDADYRHNYKIEFEEIASQLLDVENSDTAIPPNTCEQLLNSRLSACVGARYNFIIANDQGTVLYRTNNDFVTGNQVAVIDLGYQVILSDVEKGTAIGLNVDRFSSDSTTIMGFGINNQTSYTTVESINGRIKSYDRRVYLFLYDSATIKYLNDTYPATIRARGKSLLTLSIVTFAAYWLVLALWVFFDARRLGRGGWKWAGWTLALNVLGFTAYIVARSHGFGTETCCANCNRAVEKEWVRCPYCGEKPEEAGM